MSGPSTKIAYSMTNQLLLKSRPRFTEASKQVIARASAGAFGAVYNPGRQRSIAKGLHHGADQYRAYIRELTNRRADLWHKIPSEFGADKSHLRYKVVMQKISGLLKQNNTYQTPKK